MGLSDDLLSEVNGILRAAWTERDGQKVPEAEDLKLLGNDAVKLSGTVLYADLAESTQLVDSETKQFAAEVYKTYLLCASRIIKSEGGSITAYDGDRVMGVFIGNWKNSTAARCALKINYAVDKIINPAIKDFYKSKSYELRHGIGIDTSDLFVARTGIRGSNDLVWVGRAANYAAKLCSLRSYKGSVWITSDVFAYLDDTSKYGSNGLLMWTQDWWQDKAQSVYCSNWTWQP